MNSPIVIAAVSEGTWTFLGILVTNAVLLAGLFWRQKGMKLGIEQINTAVNHQEEGEPTLVERVVRLEKAANASHLHRDWEREAFQTLARHVGAHLNEYPTDCSEAS
jgi:hypothetical protein